MPSTGRGGAGNMAYTNTATLPFLSNAPAPATDLEASRRSATPDYHHQHTAAVAAENLESRETQEYAHKGRGGAGNYYSPKELVAKGRFEGAETSHVLGDGTPEARSAAGAGAGAAAVKGDGSRIAKEQHQQVPAGPAYRGRGGAGNYAFGVTEAEEKAAARRKTEELERLRGDIEKGVEEGLARPEKAKLPAGEPF